jgi:hypothetical protein
VTKNLVIVESPTKCGTVRKILGSEYDVKASFGHIAQLNKSAESDTGIRIEDGKVICDYEPTDRGKATLAKLKKAVKEASMVYLATDEDREGEGISSNLLMLLGLKKGQYRRVTYGEITPAAINNVDKNAAYLPALEDLKEVLPVETELRQVKYLNNRIEQDHRFIKRLTNPGLGFGSFNTARRTIQGYESMNMIRKGQIEDVEKGDVMGQISFIHEIFGVVA